MLHLSSTRRYFLFQGHADMRKGFDALAGIVTSQMHRQVLGGDVFVFMNRKRTHIKLLLWEGDGFSIYFKRLEQGTYEMPADPVLTHHQLTFLLHGVMLKSVRLHKRYQHPMKSCG